MTTEQIYEQFIIKINKNAQTDFVHCDRGRFVVLYNEAQIKYEESILQKKNEDEIRYAEKFVVPNLNLSEKTSEDNYSLFELPENYFDFISLKAKASTSYCQSATINLRETKLENIDILLEDEFNKPSFDYREAPFKIGNGNIITYKDNFTYDSVILTYYRYPQEIQLINPEDPESQFDESKQSEWDKKSNNRIIDLAASRFFLNNDDAKYQPTKIEAIQK
jgi:hypothetical protein